MPKFGRKVPHLRCELLTSFKVKRSKIRVRGGWGIPCWPNLAATLLVLLRLWIILSWYRQRLFDYTACLILYEHCIEVTHELCISLCYETTLLGWALTCNCAVCLLWISSQCEVMLVNGCMNVMPSSRRPNLLLLFHQSKDIYVSK